MSNIDLSEIIKRVKQPSFDDNMIMMLIQGLNCITEDYYYYIQSQNKIEEDSGKIDRDAEQELWRKKEQGYNQKDIFRHMGCTSDIDYVISRLYVNCSKKDLMKILHIFIDKCEKQNLPSYFKYSSDEDTRADQIVIYSNLADLSEYIHILQEIGSENPDILQRCNKPPILAGTIDGWIGIGDEPSIIGKSYTEIRASIIKSTLQKCVPYYIDKEGFIVYSTDGIDYDRIRRELRLAFEKYGINIDTFAFNNENMQLYMLDKHGIQEYDSKKKTEIRNYKDKLIQKKKTQDSYMEELIIIQKLKILKQMGLGSEAIDTMLIATINREGLLKDVTGKRANPIVIIEELKLPFNYFISDDYCIRVREQYGISDISNEDKQQVIPKIQEDIANYYINFFNEELAIIDETLKRYSELVKLPKGENKEIDLERIDLYSKLTVLSQGKAFFKEIGIPEEQIEIVCNKAQDLLTTIKRETEEAERPQIEARREMIDIEYLDVLFKDTGITDPAELRKLYEGLPEDAKVSKEALEAYLSNFTNPDNMSPLQIGKSTTRVGIGTKDIIQIKDDMREKADRTIDDN